MTDPGPELDLHRLTVEEALSRLDRYLYEAYVAGLAWVRVVHGKGSGTLREVVRRELGQHPLVGSFRRGLPGEGGDGVTVVQLTDR